MDKGKYQPWSHEEFLADLRVRKMTPLARKTYMLLLHEAWFCATRPNLPDDEKTLEMMADCSCTREWRTIREQVLGMFEKAEVNGQKVLVNKRLGKDWEHLQEILEAKAEAGRKGGLAKASKRLAQLSNSQNSLSNKERIGKVGKVSEEEEMKTDGKLDLICEQFFGKRAKLRKHQQELRRLIYVHKGSAVERAFGEWCAENSEDPDITDPLGRFLGEADALLSVDTLPARIAKDPATVSLTREMTYLSAGAVAFQDKQRVRLAEVLRSYSEEEILSVWKTWLDAQGEDDPRFFAGKFVQQVDDLCYAQRRQRQEQEIQSKAREEAIIRLQREADAEKPKESEEPDFDPLSA